MQLDEDLRRGLSLALNEADLLGFEVDSGRRMAAATFRVLTLPENGPPPEDRRVQVLFTPVGRVAASLREGIPKETKVVPFEITELLGVVRSFGALPIYGWKFFDVDQVPAADWMATLSVDWCSGPDGRAHSITVFQDGGPRVLDLCVWFDDLEVRFPDGRPLSLEDFVAGGKRWWDGLRSGDERTKGYGIIPG